MKVENFQEQNLEKMVYAQLWLRFWISLAFVIYWIIHYVKWFTAT